MLCGRFEQGFKLVFLVFHEATLVTRVPIPKDAEILQSTEAEVYIQEK